MVRSLLLSMLLFGCSRSPAPSGAADPEALAKLKAEIKAELKTELKAELTDELGKLPPREAPTRGTIAQAEPAGEEAEVPAADEEPTRLAQEPPAPPAPEPRPAPPAVDPPIRSDVERPKPRTDPELEPAPFPAGPDEDATVEPGRIGVMRFEVARGIDREKREPTDAGSVFDLADTPVLYGYLVAKNEGEDSKATIEWLQSGEVRCRLDLKVGHSTRGWRTWASCRLNPKWVGAWTARVLDTGGKVVAKASFKVR